MISLETSRQSYIFLFVADTSTYLWLDNEDIRAEILTSDLEKKKKKCLDHHVESNFC